MGFFTGREPVFAPPPSAPEDVARIPLTWGESFGAGLSNYRTNLGTLSDPLNDKYRSALGALAEAFPDDPELSRALIPDVGSINPLLTDDMGARLDRFEARILEAKERGLEVKTRLEAFGEAMFEAREAEERAARAGGIPGFLGTAAGAVVDPVNILTLPFAAARGANYLRKIGVAAAANAGAQAVTEAARAPGRARLGMDVTPGEAAFNIGAAAVGGGFAEAAGLGLARAWRSIRGTDPAGDAAAKAIEDYAEVVASNPAKGVPGSASVHLESIAAAREAVLDGRLPKISAETLGRQWLTAAQENEARIAAQVDQVRAAMRSGAPPLVRRIDGGIEIQTDGNTLQILDPSLARGKWTLPKIEKALQGQLDQIEAVRSGARQMAADAEAGISRLVGDDYGRGDGQPFRNPRQAEKARAELGDPSLEVVRLGKQSFVLRANRDGAVDLEAAPIAPPETRAADFVASAPADNLAAQAAKEAIDATGDRELTMAGVENYWRGRADGRGANPTDAFDADDAVMAAGADDDILEHAIGTGMKDADGNPETRSVREVFEEADEEIGALASIRNCVIGGGQADAG